MHSSATSDHPKTWRWDEDGGSIRGTYVRMEEAATEYGRRAIVILNIDGAERGVWLFETALVSKFRDELAKRASGDFSEDERIEIDRGTEKVQSGNGRGYWPYKVRFPDAPKRKAADILCVSEATPDLPIDAIADAVTPASEDDIPF